MRSSSLGTLIFFLFIANYSLSGQTFTSQADLDAWATGRTEVGLADNIVIDGTWILNLNAFSSLTSIKGNVISSNIDEVEQIFFPQTGVSDLVVEEMSIYDRWGNLVFHNELFLANEPLSVRHSTFNGAKTEIGVYVYTIRFSDESGLDNRSGDVTLLS